MTLIAQRPPRSAQAGRAFSTPTIVHFGAVLLLAALLRAPWPSLGAIAVIAAAMGLFGTGYMLLTARRMAVQTAYKPDLEDWSFHVVLPLTAYVALAAAAAYVRSNEQQSLFAIAGASLILLFSSIHNAWDATAYHVLVARATERESS